MSTIFEIASGILNQAERRLETASGNVANVATPGFKSQANFSQMVNSVEGEFALSGITDLSHFTQYTQGTMTPSGSQLDLAISGAGMFKLIGDDQEYLSRDGRFTVDANGMLVDARGFEVADDSGRPIRLDRTDVEVQSDGTVLADGLPLARIGVFGPSEEAEMVRIGGALFAVNGDMEIMPDAMVRQGMVEGSNVVMAEEMIEMMAAIRHAEAGSQLMQTYDSLLAQAFSTFGQG